MSEFDPIKFGLLMGQVKTLEHQVTELQADMKQLLALANKSKGGFWMGMSIAATAGSVVSWLWSHIK